MRLYIYLMQIKCFFCEGNEEIARKELWAIEEMVATVKTKERAKVHRHTQQSTRFASNNSIRCSLMFVYFTFYQRLLFNVSESFCCECNGSPCQHMEVIFVTIIFHFSFSVEHLFILKIDDAMAAGKIAAKTDLLSQKVEINGQGLMLH